MKRCKTCYEPIAYSGFGRPREYCDECRQHVKHRPDDHNKVCPHCGYYFTGGGEWQALCSEECWYAVKYGNRKKRGPTLT